MYLYNRLRGPKYIHRSIIQRFVLKGWLEDLYKRQQIEIDLNWLSLCLFAAVHFITRELPSHYFPLVSTYVTFHFV